MINKTILTLAALTITTNATAMEHGNHNMMKHDGHGMKHHTKHHMMGYTPLGIMGAHTHPKGKFMLSYQYMHMDMDGTKQGTNSLTPTEVRSSGYMMAPLNMQTDMHMVGTMYGLTDNITIMGMVPYTYKKMEVERANGTRVNRDSRGLGDIKLSAITKLYGMGKKALHGSLGVSLPTGSIDEDYAGTNLAYSMQSGSGTPDLLGSLTYTDMITDTSSWGAQAKTTLRAGLNNNGYRLGNEYAASGWVSNRFAHNIGGTFIIDVRG